ncbi:hypothetical protein QTP86_034657 [Hemibagrus guttatus]|nr:hypothetical protein QTP86_034657 [Hemibagrus guttatus]
MQKKDHSWIGLTKGTTEETFTQWSDGSVLGFSKWNHKQPDNPDTEDCVQTSNNGWSDEDCNKDFTAYCYTWEPQVIVVQEMKNWEEALVHCRTHYTDLVRLTTERDLILVNKRSMEIQTPTFWTSLRFMDGLWYWVNQTSLVSDETSLPSCPARPFRCGARNIKDGVWENRDCEEKMNFICYHDIWVSYNNDKPWFTAKLRRLRSEKEAAFRSGDKGKYKEAKYRFSEELLIISSSSSYTFIPVSPTQLHTLATPHPPPLTPLTIKEEEVNRLFKRLNTRKATGPDSVSPSLLKHCANQLSPVFTDIFNTSLETCHVPACFKTSAIVPVPKKTKITGLNDYRPIALTSVVMKSFERLVLSYLKDITDPLLDPLQFAYRANRSVDDAVNMALHFILQHLDSSGSYARILFVDFSSAFNTIIPALLRDKLFQLNVPDSMCSWITDFLTDRWQFVRLGTHVSDLQHISTGSPQGCVLSPLLFSLYTSLSNF